MTLSTLHTAQPIPTYVRKDLMWWKLFLPTFNGVSMMLMEEWSTPDELCACDTCLSGCSGIMQSEYFHEEFPPNISLLKMHIHALELLTIVVALKIWGNRLKGKKVLMYCDNMSSVRMINRGSRGMNFTNHASEKFASLLRLINLLLMRGLLEGGFSHITTL